MDFASGRVKPRTLVDLQAEWAVRRSESADIFLTGWINNITNDTYAFNFGNPFSGTHFGSGQAIRDERESGGEMRRSYQLSAISCQ